MANPIINLKLELTGDWRTGIRTLQRTPYTMRRVARSAIRREGRFLRDQVTKGIQAQAPGGQSFAKLSPLTLILRQYMRRRSLKALVERGDMVKNIKLHEVDDMSVFVGLRKGAVNSDGHDLVEIGIINEFGSKGPVASRMTPKMRAFLFKALRKMGVPPRAGHGDGMIHFIIPPRPFFGPVYEKDGRKSGERVKAQMIKLLEGAVAGQISSI
jgi:hypothetical protein